MTAAHLAALQALADDTPLVAALAATWGADAGEVYGRARYAIHAGDVRAALGALDELIALLRERGELR